MDKIALVLFIVTAFLSNSEGSIPDEVHTTYGDELAGESLPPTIKLWGCRPGFKGVPDDMKVAIHECRVKYPTKSNEDIVCDRVCMWMQLGYINNGTGALQEDKIQVISQQMYNGTEANAKTAEFVECYKENNPHTEAPDIMLNRCEKAKNMLECLNKKNGEACPPKRR